MSERSERTPGEREAARLEREAARLERERRRAARDGRTLPPGTGPQPASAPPPAGALAHPPDTAPQSPPAPAHRQPQPAGISAGVQPSVGSDPHSGHLDDDGELETDEHELAPEVPSGTRRVSRRDQPVAARERSPRKVRRQRLPGEPRRRHSWLGRVASVVALCLGVAVIWFLIQVFQPFEGSPHGRIAITIPPRSTSSQIGTLLERDGVIASSFFFKIRATLADERGDLRAGTYHLQFGMSYSAVLAVLTKVPPVARQSELTITAGHTRQAVNALLRQQHIRGNYLAATRSSPLLNPRDYGVRHKLISLEGFLFPDTFKLVDPITVPALVADQLVDFKRRFATVNLSYARRKHLTPYDVLKIASLIEAEAATEHDRPLVSSVIYNRLADGMMLQFDSTTRYATGNYNRPLTVSELHSRSPWNTHTHLGLPPTPIDSPGLASIQAAAHPARTNYLFFYARSCGRGTVYASNYSQFLNLIHRDQSEPCRASKRGRS